ncbi:SRPBCC family protein [Lentzea alba]|uniref:SRPBCC family protein n=1 Tax=Lentzea alba TaxID=2714351 RepID=UPI0039BF77E4
MTQFEVVTRFAVPPERLFDLSLDVEVHTGSMARSGEKVVGGVTSGGMRLGDTVTWQARHFGLRWRLTSHITAYDRPHHFVDEQVAGPFRHWRHDHHFARDGDGTLMRDVVEFAAPFGPLGRVAERLVLDRYMPRLIRLRNEHLGIVASGTIS